MLIETLRAIAVAAAPPENGKARAFFSKTVNGWSNVTGTAEGFFDHAAGAHISRTETGVFHHGLNSHIRFEAVGSQFKGFDHGSQRHFFGSVQGENIVICDQITGANHLYTFRAQEG
jgi:hypothetical protein